MDVGYVRAFYTVHWLHEWAGSESISTPKMEGWDTPDQSKPGATVAASLFDL
jgi:hypothetical protein